MEIIVVAKQEKSGILCNSLCQIFFYPDCALA